MKGWIALDIDGTITQDKYNVPSQVLDFLKKAQESGWSIALATGRAFVFAKPALEKIDFPYYLLPQNGSVALSMPQQKILFRRYMDPSIIKNLEDAFKDSGIGFVVYSGVENEDRCYYCKSHFSEDMLDYLVELQKREKEPWVEVESFDLNFSIPLIKAFGRHDRLKKIANFLSSSKLANVALIRDPFHSSFYILLITDNKASKGESLKSLLLKYGRGDLVIGAGDDENDISLLKASDVKISMPHAPEALRKIADFVAPPVSELGIIKALSIVIENAENQRLKNE